MGHEVQEYTCSSCGQKSPDINYMKKHVNLHKQVIKCQVCHYESKAENKFIEHAIRNHSYSSNKLKKKCQLRTFSWTIGRVLQLWRKVSHQMGINRPQEETTLQGEAVQILSWQWSSLQFP